MDGLLTLNRWPEMNISFTEKQQQDIAWQVSGGDYQNASEVVRDALRLHEIYRHRIVEELRAEIAKGWDGPTSNKTVQDIIASKGKSRSKWNPGQLRITCYQRRLKQTSEKFSTTPNRSSAILKHPATWWGSMLSLTN